jgi:hypothetical protein
MASNPSSSKWNLSNWTVGPVTLFQALGIKKGTVSYPQLTATLTEAASSAAGSGSGSSSSGGTSTPQEGGNTNTPASSSLSSWIKTLLTALGAPLTTANINSISSWVTIEQGSATTGGSNNPLNTTQPASGATSINSKGVKAYKTAAEGIAATVATIQQYPQILAALKSGKGLCGSSLASSFSEWSGGGYTQVC